MRTRAENKNEHERMRALIYIYIQQTLAAVYRRKPFAECALTGGCFDEPMPLQLYVHTLEREMKMHKVKWNVNSIF